MAGLNTRTTQAGLPRRWRALLARSIWTTVALVSTACKSDVGARSTEVDLLVEQLQGGTCRYEAQSSDWKGRVEQFRCSKLPWQPFRRLTVAHPDLTFKLDAARCLQALGHDAKGAVPALLDALRNDIDVYDTGDGLLLARGSYAQALGAIGDPRAIDPLIDTLRHSQVETRTAAAQALGEFGSAARNAADSLSEQLRDANRLADCADPCGCSSSNPVCPPRCACARFKDATVEALALVDREHATATFARIMADPFGDRDLTDSVVTTASAIKPPLSLRPSFVALAKAVESFRPATEAERVWRSRLQSHCDETLRSLPPGSSTPVSP
jgi:hypothetical protein